MLSTLVSCSKFYFYFKNCALKEVERQESSTHIPNEPSSHLPVRQTGIFHRFTFQEKQSFQNKNQKKIKTGFFSENNQFTLRIHFKNFLKPYQQSIQAPVLQILVSKQHQSKLKFLTPLSTKTKTFHPIKLTALYSKAKTTS